MQGTELAIAASDLCKPVKPGATASVTLMGQPAATRSSANKPPPPLPRSGSEPGKALLGRGTLSDGVSANSEMASADAAAADKRFFPFSLGPRQCLGRSLAHVMHDAAVAKIVAGYHLELAPRMGGPAGVEAACINRLTLQPGTGMWMRFHKRSTIGM